MLLLLATTQRVNGQETYMDNFSSVSYANNNGSQNFSINWDEDNDDNSASNGYIRITGNELRFSWIWGENIRRSADLSVYSSATLTFDWRTVSLEANETLAIQISSDGNNFTTLATFGGANNGSFSQDISTYLSSTTTIRFASGANNWSDGGDLVYIDDVLISATSDPFVSIDDVTVNENDGTATFTARHSGVNTTGPFTVNFQTIDGTATAGTDYTSTSGTLNFNGTVGDSEQITVPIIDNTLYDGDSNFNIQFVSVSDTSVNIADTATGNINDDEVILNNPNLVITHELDGYLGYTTTGGSLRTQDNNTNACSITTASSNTPTSSIPGTAVIEKAILYWSHSNATPDTQVTFEGNTVDAELMYTTSMSGGRIFYGGVSDVTGIVSAIPNPSTNTYDFSGLTIDNSPTYCNSATVLGGWSLLIFYSDASLPASTINVYQGFHGESNTSSTYTLNGFYAIGASGSKTTVLSWEGDQTLNNNEALEFTTTAGTNDLVGDGDNTLGNPNPFNSTIFDNSDTPIVNNTTSYGLDLDTYDVSAFINSGESSATTRVESGQDFVILNAVVLKVPSNLVVGTVFEDVNYGGGVGRDQAGTSGLPIENAVVELYDSSANLVQSTTTDATGEYSFGGMINGTYNIRVVNNTIRSTRTGGNTCTSCIPVQTYKTDYVGSVLVPEINLVGGANPDSADPSAGILAGAQSIGTMTIFREGVDGMDFGFNFNTIVNTNEDGQGSLEQFIVNSNALDESGLDIEANSIFDPAAGDDTSVFMIPSTSDPLGRTADSNFASGYFDISVSNGNPLTAISGNNTKIDGRTQTAYSGDTNTGTIGAGGTAVGTSGTLLPDFELPEIQVHRNNGDVLQIQGNNDLVRNIAVYANQRTAILFDDGNGSTVSHCLVGVDALGANSGSSPYAFEIEGTTVTNLFIDSNYISETTLVGVLINGGTGTKTIQNNHIFETGDSQCDIGIDIRNGSDGVIIQNNLIEDSQGISIKLVGPGGVNIFENTITGSGQNTANCSGSYQGYGISLEGSNCEIRSNIVYDNGGAGIVLFGSTSNGNLISRNSFYNNGTHNDALGIDINADGVTLNDAGDSDTGPNGAINFPVLETAFKSGSNLIVTGWSRPGATIEFFLTDIGQGTATIGDNQLGMSVDYGEGQEFLISLVEGSGFDTDSGSSIYTDDDGNTDTTNKFAFTFPVGPGVVLGKDITATATIANSTSEFSPFSKLKAYTVITNRRITYRVKKD